jgi:hypothetical protein
MSVRAPAEVQALRRRTYRLTRRGKIVGSALLLSAGTVIALVGTSLASWTVTISNPNNTFSTNTIVLQDNQGGQGGSATSSGTAIFNVTNLEPNSSATTACIGVVFAGTSASSMTLGATLGGGGQSTLQSELTMNAATYNTSGSVSVTGGSNTNSGSCTNYPAGGSNQTIGTQGATLQSWAAGGPYTIASPVTNTWYKFTVSGLPSADSSCATYCGQTITVTLTWTLTTT